LDARYGRVYRHRAGTDSLERLVNEPAFAARWTRLAVDRQGRVYLLEPGMPQLSIFDVTGKLLSQVGDAGDVGDNFDPPAVRLDYEGRFCLPESLARLCARTTPSQPPAPEGRLTLCQAAAAGMPAPLIFDRRGNPAHLQADDPLGPRIYHTSGTWIGGLFDSQSKTLGGFDSQIYRCQWHRIEMELAQLPSGARLIISTYTDQQQRSRDDIVTLSENLWETRYVATGQMQPPPSARSGRNGNHEFLVLSREGQYLWIKVELSSDGFATPIVSSIRVHYPRDSYLKYLPAVYSSDDDSRRFLERFLSIFQTEWDRIQNRIAHISQYFDPAAVPAGPFLDYLAEWLALPLEASWTTEQKRRLLAAMPRIYPKLGTLDGTREYLKVYLENIIGSVSSEAYPQIVEGFRQRQWFSLSMGEAATLGGRAPVWSPGVVGRIQLDVYSQEGQVRLVGTDDPKSDPFLVYAHRFSVFVPSCWVNTGEDERMIRRALDTAKPAHTAYDLILVEPRFRVGAQSTVGLDTILGTYPVAHLAASEAADAPPSRLPCNRLGYDTVLAADPVRAWTVQLAPAVRVGIETSLM
jgi:phage tail-like protein